MVGNLLVLVLAAIAVLVCVRLVRALRDRRDAAVLDSQLAREERRRVGRAERARRRAERRAEREAYLDSLPFVNFYQLVIIFTVASIGGLILETLWTFFVMGVWQRRYGMIWGPFSPLYGVGAVILTLALWKLRRRPLWMAFAVSLVLGSCLEQFAGVVMEDGFNATSWSYSHMPDAITKYVSLRMSVIWGFLGCVWCRAVMPELVWRIGEPARSVKRFVTVALTAFLVVDGAMTVYVAARKDARDQGIPPANAIERYIDDHYNDGFLEKRFENVEFGEPGAREPGA